MVMLGIRASLKEDLSVSPAELFYYEPLRLPGEFFVHVKLVLQFQNSFKDLAATTHVFVRRDSVRRFPEHPYNGPYKVLSRTDKVFTLDMNGQKRTITVYRLKPAYILNHHLDPTDVLAHSHLEYKTRYGRTVRFRITFPAKSFLIAKTLLDIPISVTPHKTLNSVRGVISEPELFNTSESEILEEAKKLCLPPSVPSFATIVQQRKSFDTAEKFIQTDLSFTSMFCASKVSVSTLTDDKICNVTRPPKKKRAKQDTSIDFNENITKSQNTDFLSEYRESNDTFVQDRTELSCPTSSLRETDNLHPDDTEVSESDDYIDYDPEETIDEDMINVYRQQPSTSRTINPRFYPTFKKKYAKHRRKKKS
ncbi:hypothetical protein HNY73_001528 [Argiope bruennichi]|uniref:Uncharacterized protein n=1 Tax=Argiope bruennichi TaxID=94029 RepID=A0A8T0G7J2_ARGBR|nr:hypothetical protein HNY73_001528 [Argiope bruennichi]